MDLAVLRDLLIGTGAGGGGLYLLYRILLRMGSGQKAATASSDATTGIIERLEKHIERAEQRAIEAIDRADRAERERNGALLQIDRLTFTIESLQTDIRNLKTQVESYAQRTSPP